MKPKLKKTSKRKQVSYLPALVAARAAIAKAKGGAQ
jgi:hypothetical protein